MIGFWLFVNQVYPQCLHCILFPDRFFGMNLCMSFMNIKIVKNLIPELSDALTFLHLLEPGDFIVEDHLEECCDGDDRCDDECCWVRALRLTKMLGAAYLEEAVQEDAGAENEKEYL